MKKLLIFTSILWFAATIWAAQVAIDETGKFYSVKSAADEQASFLIFEITSPNGTVESTIVPGTYDQRVDEDPFILYIPRFKKLYITWTFGDGDFRNVTLISYDIPSGSWSDFILLSDRSLVKRFHANSIFTTGRDNTGFFHVIWWEEYDTSYGDTVYCVIPFGDQDLNYSGKAVHPMAPYIITDSSVDYTYPPSSYRYPNIWSASEGNRVSLLVPSPQSGYYAILNVDYDNLPLDIESDQRAHFPDIGVASFITINAFIDTSTSVHSVYTSSDRIVFYWETESSMAYVFYCSGLWSMPRYTQLKGLDEERLRTLFQSIIR
ncbi:MAG TPA: hypothetical protein PK014_06730 [Thermoanaerobaculia bacterium]|mgnify:CR=1 FL=1|nr:hypothetical protein [Thermoanaerobaculia bacterium]HUM29866.1 hypothetical protein [Thermoanaerobaculia bacterium]HXK68141.1 hypothetical protein [Thermoanaerobaculia bacterium]